MKKLLLLALGLLTSVIYSQTPGGVANTNMRLWVSGDANVTNTEPGDLDWLDRSGKGNDVFQPTTDAKPSQSVLFNYNETFTFDGEDDYLAIKNLNHATGSNISDVYAFIVYKTDYNGSNAYNANWSLLDFDRSDAYNVYIQGNGSLGMSFRSFENGIIDASDEENITTNDNIPHLGTFIFDNNAFVEETRMKVDGKLGYTNDNTTSNIAVQRTRYGFIGDGSEANIENGSTIGDPSGRNLVYYEGAIAEVILFDKTVVAADVLKIESYLALKYGITLDAENLTYKDSNGTTIWDNIPYWNNVAGIIKDDVTGSIDQKIGSSVNSELVVATTNNYTLANSDGSRTSLANDGDYVLFGDNGVFGYENFDGGSDDILKRKWLFSVGESPAVPPGTSTQNVHIAIPIDFFPSTATAVQLIISPDDTFTGADALSASSTNGDYYYWNVNIKDQDRISFVVTGLGKRIAGITPSRFEMVLRADKDLTIGATLDWLDATSNDTDGFQNTTSRIPGSSEFMNFNPTLDFDGANDYIALKNKNYKEKDQLKNIHSFVVYSTDYNVIDSNPNFDNWGFLDFDRSESYNMFIRPDGKLAFSYQSERTTKDLFSESLGNDGVPHIAEFKFEAALEEETFMKFDGRIEYQDDLTNRNIVVKQDRFGFIGDGSEADMENGTRNNIHYDGKISEVIMADKSALTNEETLKLESYLALKYGITLSVQSNVDGTPSIIANYLNSSGTVIWDNEEYWHGVAGLIKDDVNSDLNQKVAESESTSFANKDIVVATSQDFTSPNAGRATELNEGESLLFGNNSLNKGKQAYAGGGGTGDPDFITLRKWFFKEVGGSTDLVYIAVRKSFLDAEATSVRIIISEDDVFTGTDPDDTVAPMIEDGDFYYYAHDIDDEDRVAFVYELPFVESPGGIATNLNMWLKADKNLISSELEGLVSGLGDSGLEGHGASQDINLDKPTASTYASYNPIITFDGASEHLAIENLNYSTAGAVSKLYSWVVYESDFTGADNSSFYDFDKDEYYSTSVGGDGTLGFSYTTSDGTFNNQGATATNDGVPKLGGFVFDTALGANETMIRLNGAVDFEGDVSDNAIGTGTVTRFGFVGDGSAATTEDGGNTEDYYNGKIAEIVQYEGTTIASGDIHKIESYLAFKYGITLDNTAGGTAGDYIDTDATVIWDASDNSDYHQNVAGIGRDDETGLNQRQAISTAQNSVLTISVGDVAVDNKSNTGNIAFDKNYLMWGSKSTGAVLGEETAGFRMECNLPMLKVNRDWKIQITGTDIDEVTLQFDMTGFTSPDLFNLLVDTDQDGDFTTGSLTQHTSGVLSGDVLTFSNITGIVSGDVITLERKATDTGAGLNYEIVYEGGSWTGGNGLGTGGGPSTVAGDEYKRVHIKSSTTAAQDFVCDCLVIDGSETLTVPTGQYVRAGELVLNGDLYLDGTAEFVQTKEINSNTGTGQAYKILGEATDSPYRYNYFTSPVNTSGSTTLASNLKFNTGATLGDNTDPSFTRSRDGSGTTLSTRWTHTLNNGDDFVEIDENTVMPSGVGFNMKGTGATNKYNFIGTPNNGDINVPITAGKFLLTGNPYPSSIDINKFNAANSINSGVIENTIYLWDQPNGDEHFPTETDDSGGYATIKDGVTVGAATFEDETTEIPDATTPSRFIKPGQGFIVYGENTGDVRFTNNMRSGFVYDDSRPFFETKKLKTIESVIRLGFEYTTDNNKVYHRQIANVLEEKEELDYIEDVTAEDILENAVRKKVSGKDAFMFDYFANDAYWVIPNEEDRFVITTSAGISDDLELPIGVVVDEQREVSFKLDNPEAIFGAVYLFDKEEASITNIKDKSYTALVNTGDYRERFSLIFSGEETGGTLENDVIDNDEVKRVLKVSKNQITVILEEGVVDKIQLYNLSGQLIVDYDESKGTNHSTVNFNELSNNVYVVKVITDTKTITQKVIIN